MKPQDLILRCYAKQEADDLWVGLCLDFNLAVQSETFEGVEQKMRDSILFYIEDALDDDENFNYLLNRKAPWSEYAKFYTYKYLHKMRSMRFSFYPKIKPFTEPLPLIFS